MPQPDELQVLLAKIMEWHEQFMADTTSPIFNFNKADLMMIASRCKQLSTIAEYLDDNESQELINREITNFLGKLEQHGLSLDGKRATLNNFNNFITASLLADIIPRLAAGQRSQLLDNLVAALNNSRNAQQDRAEALLKDIDTEDKHDTNWLRNKFYQVLSLLSKPVAIADLFKGLFRKRTDLTASDPDLYKPTPMLNTSIPKTTTLDSSHTLEQLQVKVQDLYEDIQNANKLNPKTMKALKPKLASIREHFNALELRHNPASQLAIDRIDMDLEFMHTHLSLSKKSNIKDTNEHKELLLDSVASINQSIEELKLIDKQRKLRA